MITVTDLPGLAKHLDATDPHNLTKSDVDLENVQNFPVASSAEAKAGGVNNKYMTPLLTKLAIEALTSDEGLANHIKASNPHNITKSTIGLENVGNYPNASSSEAREGTRWDRYMTPMRVHEAIYALVDTDGLSNHLSASNPHNITKTTVGLSNVQNYAIASSTEAKAGSRSDRYMTPYRVKEAIDALASSGDGWEIDAVDDGLFGYLRHTTSGLTLQWGQTSELGDEDGVWCYYRRPFTTRPFSIVQGVLGTSVDMDDSNPGSLVEINLGIVGRSITATRFAAVALRQEGGGYDGGVLSWMAMGITSSSGTVVNPSDRIGKLTGWTAYEGKMYASNNHIVAPFSGTSSGGGSGGSAGGGNGCLLPDVKLLLESGKYIEAKNAKVGDRLRTVKFKGMLDSSTNENWADWTTKDISKPIDDIVTIKSIRKDTFREFYVINNTLKITQQHEIFTCSDGVWRWSDVRDIAVDDHVLNEQGNKVKVDTLEKFIVNVDTYNLDVEETDTYFAGGYLVHNAEQVKELA